MLHIPSNPESAIVSTIVGPEEKNFKVKFLRWHENNILILIFANTAFLKGTILLIKQNLMKMY